MLGQLYDGSDVDTFAIMVSRPSGVTVCAMAEQRSDDGWRVRLAIFDGVGTLRAARSVRGGALEATCITARAIDVGMYYVVADGYPDFPTFDSDYRLTFAFYDDFGSLDQREVEPNEDQVSATPATIGTTPIAGQMSSEDDADFYAFDVGVGGEIEFRLLPESQSLDGGAITVSVLDPNGQIISEGRVPGSARLPLVLNVAPRGPGAHFIRVSRADRNHVFEQDYLIETRWVDRAPGFDLTIDIEGRGNGTVEIEPGGIRCTERCTETFAPGTVVTLSAVAEDGSTFGGWGGGCHDIGSTCVLAMAEDRSVAASFQLGTVSECGSNVHRFWNLTTQAHFYTISEAEADFVIRSLPEWRYEGFAWRFQV